MRQHNCIGACAPFGLHGNGDIIVAILDVHQNEFAQLIANDCDARLAAKTRDDPHFQLLASIIAFLVDIHFQKIRRIGTRIAGPANREC